MAEFAPQRIPVEEHIVGRANFMRKMFHPESIEKFLGSPQIDFGREPGSERRLNLVIVGMHFAYRAAEYDGDLRGVVAKWVNEPHILLDFREPMDYLGYVSDHSESLWLSAAACALSGEAITYSEDETASIITNLTGAFNLIEEQYRA